ncbi:helix-turn-helix transcriptional regulator [Sphaerisporangium sp. NPDC049002]|uniref:helix-turn-helix domain-containing protein n=1 Tax=unclassified Sphaerisporangium TaxID=2630420 RepID=UPI0033C5FD80
MSIKRGMTLRAQWLGRELRELREAAGLTASEVAGYIERTGATVSRFEAGLYPARTSDVQVLLNLYGVDDPQRRDNLVRLATEVWQTGWWESYSDALSKNTIDYAWIESRARLVRSFDALVVPGLLQTRAYMEAVISAADPDASAEQMMSWVRFRLTRQQVLTDREPPHIEAILDESVLHRAPGALETMASQLSYLIDLAERPTVDIRVLPFASGAHASPEGAFMIFELPSPYPDVAFVDTPAGGIYVETRGVQRLETKYRHIRRRALDPDESVGLIRAAADRYA